MFGDNTRLFEALAALDASRAALDASRVPSPHLDEFDGPPQQPPQRRRWADIVDSDSEDEQPAAHRHRVDDTANIEPEVIDAADTVSALSLTTLTPCRCRR